MLQSCCVLRSVAQAGIAPHSYACVSVFGVSPKSLQCQPSLGSILRNQFVMHKIMPFVDWFTRCIFISSCWICMKLKRERERDGQWKTEWKKSWKLMWTFTHVCMSGIYMLSFWYDAINHSVLGWRALKFLVFRSLTWVCFLFGRSLLLHRSPCTNRSTLIRFIKGYPAYTVLSTHTDLFVSDTQKDKVCLTEIVVAFSWLETHTHTEHTERKKLISPIY